MGLLSFLKRLFNKNKALPEESAVYNSASCKTNEGGSNLDEVFPKANIDLIPKGIDYAIDQYISGMLYRYENGMPINSYKNLISLSAYGDDYVGNNAQNQEVFLYNARENLYNPNMEVMTQRSNSTGKPVFYHISTKDNQNGYKNRIYLNCKKENVALMADRLCREFGNSQYYFKFNAAENQSDRSEQFVFYINDDNEMNRVIQTIERTHQKYPQLFEGSRNINPFMKNIDGYIAYAPNVNSRQYVTLDGKLEPVEQSYNSLLSKALQDSLLNSVRDVASRDLSASQKLGGVYHNDLSPFLESGVLEDLFSGEKRAELIEKMKKNLSIASQNNKELDIKGINVPKNREMGEGYTH